LLPYVLVRIDVSDDRLQHVSDLGGLVRIEVGRIADYDATPVPERDLGAEGSGGLRSVSAVAVHGRAVDLVLGVVVVRLADNAVRWKEERTA